MPNRIIREDILTSEAVDKLDFAAEVFYRRLLSKVDDYRRFHANPKLLLSNLYQLRANDIKCSQIDKWLAQTVAAKLVRTYTNDGKLYLEVAKFRQQIRTASKFPEPPANQMHINGAADAQQLHTRARPFVSVSVSEVLIVSVDWFSVSFILRFPIFCASNVAFQCPHCFERIDISKPSYFFR